MSEYYLYGAGWDGEQVELNLSDEALEFHYFPRPDMQLNSGSLGNTPDFEVAKFIVVLLWDGNSIAQRMGFCLDGDIYSRPSTVQRKINALLTQESKAANTGDSQSAHALGKEIIRLEAILKKIS